MSDVDYLNMKVSPHAPEPHSVSILAEWRLGYSVYHSSGESQGIRIKNLEWRERKNKIIAFLSRILLDVIEPPPHTTPTRVGNRTIQGLEARLCSLLFRADNKGRIDAPAEQS